MRGTSIVLVGVGLLAWPACNATTSDNGNFGDGTDGTQTDGSSGTSGPSDDHGDSSESSGDDTSATGTIFDMGQPDRCKAPDEDMARTPAPCTDEAPPESWDEQVQWEWWGLEAEGQLSAIMTPLVVNLTDDDGNGSVDLCDVPDIIVPVYEERGIYDGMLECGLEFGGHPVVPGHLVVLDGETGAVHFTIPGINGVSQPALGDIDGDGLPELIIASANGLECAADGPLLAFNHDGSPVEGFDGTFAESTNPSQFTGAPALADLDHDGSPEILLRNAVFSNMGELLVELPDHVASGCAGDSATTVADLDEDGAPEIVLGRSAYTYHADGTVIEYYRRNDVGGGYPHVADLDGDSDPEILVTSGGINVLDHQGNVLIDTLKPFETNENGLGVHWCRPGAVHDFDGDDVAEFAFSAGDTYAILSLVKNLDWTLDVVATWPVADQSGAAAGTAFDFLGDSTAEAIYGDEEWLWVFDSAAPQAPALVNWPRASQTWTEYPVVADVDNDGSAEIVVVSATRVLGIDPYEDEVVAPTVSVVRDSRERWIQSRRIWNQHTYHVTNVREDGTIPTVEQPSWKYLNTFRTNAQIEGGSVCEPPA